MPRHARAQEKATSSAEQSLPTQRAPVHDTTEAEPEVGERLHPMTIAMGMFDARVSGVDFFDTEGGREVMRWYRQVQRRRRTGHHPTGHHPEKSKAA